MTVVVSFIRSQLFSFKPIFQDIVIKLIIEDNTVKGVVSKLGIKYYSRSVIPVKFYPFAANKEKQHFLKCIEISEDIGAQSLAGEAYMGLGLWCKSKGTKEEAKKSFSEAIRRFEKGELKGLLQQAKEAMASLE